MKASCEIIKDLLPLYHDEVCSNDSKTMIEEHLKDCDSCKAELQAMDEEFLINNKDQNLKEAEAVKKLSRKWKKGMLKSLIKGILSTLLVIAAIALVLYLFMDIRVS
ncbi:zf-HC2 domain-containing protein [Irregularibacter muris]|uniref:Zf-HC2 domain-containing protein n=1 Tax=Irregularibacter muris TaxID=1796619 RepID=A0AAE3HCK4_9FIRM|nr:zf-HC2 domain-containing protein [Irregularibacter muris]MCR1897486.1 zf-HC2 domain-containing protein [Irregularibacter muris]